MGLGLPFVRRLRVHQGGNYGRPDQARRRHASENVRRRRPALPFLGAPDGQSALYQQAFPVASDRERNPSALATREAWHWLADGLDARHGHRGLRLASTASSMGAAVIENKTTCPVCSATLPRVDHPACEMGDIPIVGCPKMPTNRVFSPKSFVITNVGPPKEEGPSSK